MTDNNLVNIIDAVLNEIDGHGYTSVHVSIGPWVGEVRVSDLRDVSARMSRELMPVLTAEETEILQRAYFEGASDALDDVEPIITQILDASTGSRSETC